MQNTKARGSFGILLVWLAPMIITGCGGGEDESVADDQPQAVSAGPKSPPITVPYVASDTQREAISSGPTNTPLTIPYIFAGPKNTPLTIPYIFAKPLLQNEVK